MLLQVIHLKTSSVALHSPNINDFFYDGMIN